MFKMIDVQWPLVELLEQTPKYAKYLKEFMMKKRRYGDCEIVALTNDILKVEKGVAIKQKDPGSFTLPCTIRSSPVQYALCDLGASINLMSLSMYNAFGLTGMKKTSITL